MLCPVELNNGDGELLDNMTVYFETEDTCFCYGHCGCAVSRACACLSVVHYNNVYNYIC